MKARLKEIKARIAELDALQRPLYQEEAELEREKDRIHAQAVKKIALGHTWVLHYNADRGEFYLEPEWTEPHIRERIQKHTTSYHESFLLEGDEETTYETVKLHISDGDVSIWFSNTEMFEQHISKFKIDTSEIDRIKKSLQERMDALHKFDPMR